MKEDRIRVLRVLEYEGPRSWVEETLRRRAVKEEHTWGTAERPCIIREAVVHPSQILTESGVDKTP